MTDPEGGTAVPRRAAPRRRVAVGDVVAGVSVALILVPQALAYAEIAGLPAVLGLYAAAVAPIAASFFASSPYLQTGPVAMTSLLTFAALTTVAPTGTAEYVGLAALLALIVGAFRLALGLVRAGVVAYFMSQPVIAGFTSGAALLIAASQLPLAVGVTPPDGRLLERAWWTLRHAADWSPEAVVLALVTAALVVAGRRIGPLFPGVLVAVVAGLVWSAWFDFPGPVVGGIPGDLPMPSLGLPWSDVWRLLVPGAVIALIGFAEPSAIARVYAAQDRMPWSPNREFISQGAANLASGLFGAFPVGGSFSRSSVNRAAGAKTRWSGAVTGLVVLAFIPFSGILEDLPLAVLGAAVIASVAALVRLGAMAQIARSSLPQGAVAWGTFAATLVLSPHIEVALILGIGLGVVIHLWRELEVETRTEYRDGVLRFRPSGVLFFASAPALDQSMLDALVAHPEAERVEIDLEALGRIDYTGARALRSVAEAFIAAGLPVTVIRVPPHARRILGKVWAESLHSREIGG